MGQIAAFLLALCLILAGIMMMDTKQDDRLTDAVIVFAEKTDQRFDNVERDLEMLKYGQLLNAAHGN